MSIFKCFKLKKRKLEEKTHKHLGFPSMSTSMPPLVSHYVEQWIK